MVRKSLRLACGALSLSAVCGAGAADSTTHNVILFVPDGLRARQVDAETAPAMAAVRDRGTRFDSPHSIFPTLTTPNASVLATGHDLGDTGNFGNAIYAGRLVGIHSGSTLAELDARLGGNYLNETTLLAAARRRGFSTAAIGKLGPTLIFDHTERSGETTIVLDDQTGRPEGIPLSAEVEARLAAVGLPAVAPAHEDGHGAVAQESYSIDVATRVVLPLFKARGRPFLLVFWSREPDLTQHEHQDSPNALTPGINGPSSRAALRVADDNLARLRQTLDELGLDRSTNVVVAADHGFTTIAKDSATSPAAAASYADVPAGQLPPGFVALDLARALDLPLFDPEEPDTPLTEHEHPRRGSALIGRDAHDPAVVVAANGGCDLIYLPHGGGGLAARIVDTLLAQDYVSGLFVDPTLGRFGGSLPLTDIRFKGSALTPCPSIVVGFRSRSTGCADPVLCAAAVADTRLPQGQGMHGSLSRADTMNFMAAIGPDFKSGFVDRAPVSNTDVGRTIAHLLGLETSRRGRLVGRVITEALPGGKLPRVNSSVKRSAPSASGLRTVLVQQSVKGTPYLDAAGFPGRTVGLP